VLEAPSDGAILAGPRFANSSRRLAPRGAIGAKMAPFSTATVSFRVHNLPSLGELFSHKLEIRS
jgi:hypothetical protein